MSQFAALSDKLPIYPGVPRLNGAGPSIFRWCCDMAYRPKISSTTLCADTTYDDVFDEGDFVSSRSIRSFRGRVTVAGRIRGGAAVKMG